MTGSDGSNKSIKYVLAFGNPYVEEDSLAVDIADFFLKHPVPGVEFHKCIAPDEIMNYLDKDFFILDVVAGIDDVMLIEDIDSLANEPKASVHDFDLGFFLRMMKELGSLDSVRIIGIPKKSSNDLDKQAVDDLRGRILSFVRGFS